MVEARRVLTKAEAAAAVWLVAATILTDEGWMPGSRDRSLCGAVLRACRQRFPKLTTQKADSLYAGALMLLTEKLRTRWPGATLDAWEAESAREPEHVVALLSVRSWPKLRGLAIEEPTRESLTVEATLGLLRREISPAPIAARLRAALPASWVDAYEGPIE